MTFILGGVIGAVLLLTGRANVQTRIPFGPFMILGAWVALMFPVQTVIGQPAMPDH